MRIYEPHSSSILNFDANVLALCCYLCAVASSAVPFISMILWAIPLLVYLVEKQSDFVRFHAMQAFLLQIVIKVITVVVSVPAGILMLIFDAHFFNGLFNLFKVSVSIVMLVCSIFGAVKAFQYTEHDLPLIGMLTRKFCKPLNF